LNSPTVPISWGELFDKITILQIKLNTLISKSALDNVSREHDLLQAIFTKYFPKNKQASQLLLHLQQINQQLWDIEDRIRDKERDKVFDDEFVQLARSVYITNDERSRVKRKINDVFGSDLIEEKSYADYSP
jgi:hypothetical protein